MKKLIMICVAIIALLMPVLGVAEGVMDAIPQEFFTWESIGTLAGAVAAVLLIVQYIKAPLDEVWKIPTRALVYVISLGILIVADVMLGVINYERVCLAVINAFIVSTSAMGVYEMTFKKLE